MKSLAFYREAKCAVVALGYASEIEWQASQDPNSFTESQFLREAAWVIYCSGFKEAIVRRYFDYFSLCFCDWISSQEVVDNGELCVAAATRVLANERKHRAIVQIARTVATMSFAKFKEQLLADPVGLLQTLPFLGPVTSIHLAKNLGFNIAKPDRHLIRLKDKLGYPDVSTMCMDLAQASGDPVNVVDLVLWRYMERRTNLAADERSSKPSFTPFLLSV